MQNSSVIYKILMSKITYKEFIQNILDTRGRFACGDEYHERHHIIPKCMDGTNDMENLIDLYAKEHYEAHRLLALEYPENEKLVYAWWMMSTMINSFKRQESITPEEYEEARKAYSEQMKGENNPNWGKHNLAGENHPMYGKHHTEETKKKMSEARKGRYVGENSSRYGKHHSEEAKKKNSDAHKGKCHSEEVRKKISEALKGENNPFYGQSHSEEVRKKLSAAHKGKVLSEDTKKKISDALKGENNPFYGKSHSEETKKKISKANQGRLVGDKHPGSKITCQYDLHMNLVDIWTCVKQAANELNVHKDSISNCCHMKIKTAGGFIWRYLYDTARRDGTITPGAITLGFITEEEALRILKD